MGCWPVDDEKQDRYEDIDADMKCDQCGLWTSMERDSAGLKFCGEQCCILWQEEVINPKYLSYEDRYQVLEDVYHLYEAAMAAANDDDYSEKEKSDEVRECLIALRNVIDVALKK